MAQFHVLLIRFSSLGDLVLHSACAAAIKQRWGDRVYISLLTADSFAPLMEGIPFIDEVHPVDRDCGVKDLLSRVREMEGERRIDFLVDLHGTLRSLLIRYYFWRIPRIYVDKRTWERGLLIWAKLDFLSWQYSRGRGPGWGEPMVERVPRDFAAVFHYPVDQEVRGPQGQLSFSCWTFQAERIDLELGLRPPYMVVAVSASAVEKRWPVQSFKQFFQLALQDSLLASWQFVITAGAEDDFCQQFSPLCTRYPQRLLNLQGQTTLEESVYLVKKADFCLGNDTGIPHFAESVGTPTLTILGPTGEQFGFYPHLPGSSTLSVPLWCRPCSSNGHGHCIRSRRFCLDNITPSMVLVKVKQLLAESGWL